MPEMHLGKFSDVATVYVYVSAEYSSVWLYNCLLHLALCGDCNAML